MSQMTVDQALQLALQHQQEGHPAEAEDLFRQILSVFPDQPDALHMLGALRYTHGDLHEGERLVRRAIDLNPDEALYKATLGLLLTGSGRAAQAVDLLQTEVRLHPAVPDAWLNLGFAHATLGQYAPAADAFQRVLTLTPNDSRAQANLGITLCHLGRFPEAVWVLRDALKAHPRHADLHVSLGTALLQSSQVEAAIVAFQDAIRIDPNAAAAYQNLSTALNALGRLEDAADAARRAAELLPQLPAAQITYAEALRHLGDFDQCRAAYERALLRHPHEADLHNNYGNILSDQSAFPEAIAAYRKAIELRPTEITYYSNFLYTLQFAPGLTPDEIFAEHQRFDAALCQPLAAKSVQHLNDPAPARRLRVGYISTEFRAHALGFYLLPLLANHDKSQVEVFCYADVAQPDFLTFRLRQFADRWSDIRGLSDDDLAARIRTDGIDILVDLHLHMGGNRALVFARKPAPVQIAFAGYPGTSGLSATGFRLTDKFLEPTPPVPSTEKPLAELDTFWCYAPQAQVLVSPLPALTAGHITFGNLNNFKKINDRVLALWARVLHAVPGSRLILLAAQGSHRRWATTLLERAGIAPDRITFLPRAPHEQYLQAYHAIDIGLDSFPYNGHTTSLDSTWMGVPVVTIIGNTPVSRAGFSQLSNLALTDIAARDEDDFVRIAAALAADLPRLADLRAALRPRMEASPLMNAKRFAQQVEHAYRHAWQIWCAAAPTTGHAPFGQWIGMPGTGR